MKLELKRDRRLILLFCALGFVIVGVCALYLVTTFPNRHPRAETILTYFCPFSFLTVIFMDSPHAKPVDYVIVWMTVAILNAALYGVVGSLIVKLIRMAQRRSSRY